MSVIVETDIVDNFQSCCASDLSDLKERDQGGAQCSPVSFHPLALQFMLQAVHIGAMCRESFERISNAKK